MKKVVLSLAAALAVSAAAPAFAADMPAKAPKVAPAPPPSPWDIAFGAAIMNDYIFRGVTQSGHKPSVAAYFEPRYNINANWQLYAGIAGESIKFANNAAAEIDFYGGVRPTFGPLAFDFGFWYYYYPGGQCYGTGPTQASIRAASTVQASANGNVAKKQSPSFYEIYGKVTYTWTDWAFGANFYYSPNFLNTRRRRRISLGHHQVHRAGANGARPVRLVRVRRIRPSVARHQRCVLRHCNRRLIAGSNPNGIPYADYTTWNVGFGFTWKVFTLDLRYFDTDLSKGDCNAFTSDPTAAGERPVASRRLITGGRSNWCGAPSSPSCRPT